MAIAVPSTFDLVEAKLVPPILRPGMVDRTGLFARLDDARDATVVSVVGPGGYGKTTMLAQRAASGSLPCAWLTVDELDEDPVRLLVHLVAALQREGLVDATADGGLSPEGATWNTVVPRACRTLANIATPFMIVIDDVHKLSQGDATGALGMLIPCLPSGSQLVLCGRREVSELVARFRALGLVCDIDASALALTDGESRALLSGSGVDFEPDEEDELIRRTEGWAAGLYLYVLARSAGASASIGRLNIDRSVEDYLWVEQLSAVSSDDLWFLTRSAVFERLSASLCDAVLGRSDSGGTLRRLEESNLLLVPLDRERHWYRYHELFRAVLVRELERTDSSLVDEIRNAAADWCAVHGLLEESMVYAIASGDKARMARTMSTAMFELYRIGRTSTLEMWMAHFDDMESLEAYPGVALLGALVHALTGRALQAERWLDAADRAADRAPPPPDGSSSLRDWVSAGSAMLCRQGVSRMREDAERALEGLGPLSPLRPMASLMLAFARMLEGEGDTGSAFRDAGDAASEIGGTFVGVVAYAQCALLELAAGDRAAASASINRARTLVGSRPATEYLPMALLLVAEARAAICAGDRKHAAEQLAAGHRLRPAMSTVLPYFAVQCLVEMATAHLELGEVEAARAVLVDASDILRSQPRLGSLGSAVASLRERAAGATTSASGWESSLTAAELRLLPLLTTHLTFREIGDRLFVSRNTVKTQAISIYRKLGASSRGEAVQRGVDLGLLESVAVPRRDSSPGGDARPPVPESNGA